MTGPVTVTVRRRVKAGSENAYREWLDRLTAASHDLPGYLGAEFYPPAKGDRTFASVFRFASLAELEAFETSELRASALAEVAPLVDGDAIWDRLTGLEVWFAPPPGTPMPYPSPHRMAMVLIAVVFVLVLVLNLILGPLMTGWPLPFRILLTVSLQVTLMTYVIMPRLTRVLARWIYPATFARLPHHMKGSSHVRSR